MGNQRIVLLTRDNFFGRVAAQSLSRHYSNVVTIVESAEPLPKFIRRRMKRLGVITVLGQVAFEALVVPVLSRRSASRLVEIKSEYCLVDRPFPSRTEHVKSMNSRSAQALLKDLAPSAVAVIGTRILNPTTLAATDAPFINLHAGITPLYRGVHGAYWAMAESRKDLAGVTIHLIDKGIDTGEVIEQVEIPIETNDNFVTYPYIQLGVGLQLLVSAIHCACDDTLTTSSNPRNLPSRLRYSPTVWGYVWRRVTKSVK